MYRNVPHDLILMLLLYMKLQNESIVMRYILLPSQLM